MRKAYFLLPAVLFLSLACASPEAVKEKLIRALPQTKIGEVTPSEVKGLYAVNAGPNVFYADASGKYLVLGSILDLASGEDLTAKRRLEAGKEVFASLPSELAVKVGAGSPKAALFYDPLCPYCRQALDYLLQEKLAFQVFLLPLHEGSADKAGAILCSKDPAIALAAPDQAEASAPECRKQTAERVEKLRSLARSLAVQGTPTLLLPTGERIEGFNPPAYQEVFHKAQEVAK